jgi:hypothetical protein
MFKALIKAMGVLFLLWGGINLINSLYGERAIGISIFSLVIGPFNISSFIFGVLLLNVGWNIFKLNSAGRSWALVILWWNFLIHSLLWFFILFYTLKHPDVTMDTIYGYHDGEINHMAVNAWFIVFGLLAVVLLFGVQIFLLSQKRTRILFGQEIEIQEIN